jgi:uncharacterized protein
MRILVDMWHPADVHFFKNFIWEMEKKGHKVMITSREKDVTVSLLDNYGFKHHLLTQRGEGFLGLASEMLKHDYKLYKLAKEFKPDIMMAFGGMSIGHVGKLLRKPSISFYDSEHATLIKLVSFPFLTKICTPSKYKGDLGEKQIKFDSNKELAYLHPKYVNTNKKIFEKLGIEEKEKYFVVRFISWNSIHDVGAQKISLETKRKLISTLENHGRVFISSEDHTVPEDLKKYLLPTKTHEFFDVLNSASCVVTEGATTAKEAAFLGVPTIYINALTGGDLDNVVDEYKLIEHFPTEVGLFDKLDEMLNNPELKNLWLQRRDRLISEKIDVTDWMIKLIESY